ncbi:hypothetical protein BC567DRAFT_236211 [Phyllosticta citribraziliensis]
MDIKTSRQGHRNLGPGCKFLHSLAPTARLSHPNVFMPCPPAMPCISPKPAFSPFRSIGPRPSHLRFHTPTTHLALCHVYNDSLAFDVMHKRPKPLHAGPPAQPSTNLCSVQAPCQTACRCDCDCSPMAMADET